MNTIKNVTVLAYFKDGDLASVFEELGYPAEWRRGERRDLPLDVVKRVTASGGIVSIADENARESKIVQGAEPAQIDAEAHWQKQYGKAKRARVLFPEGFRDGNFTSELAAIGHPPEIGVGEILDLPLTLIEKIKSSGGFYATDPESLAQHERQQGKHRVKVQEWQQEQARAKADRERRAGAEEHNQSILAEIEQLDTEYLTATGKSKEAVWKRRMELRKSLR